MKKIMRLIFMIFMVFSLSGMDSNKILNFGDSYKAETENIELNEFENPIEKKSKNSFIFRKFLESLGFDLGLRNIGDKDSITLESGEDFPGEIGKEQRMMLETLKEVNNSLMSSVRNAENVSNKLTKITKTNKSLLIGACALTILTCCTTLVSGGIAIAVEIISSGN